jgi:hypothetical protein
VTGKSGRAMTVRNTNNTSGQHGTGHRISAVRRPYPDYDFKSLAELDDSGFVEIACGKHTKRWKKDSIYLDEDAFVVAGGIIRKYYPKFFHYGDELDVSKVKGRKLVSDWHRASKELKEPEVDPFVAVNLDSAFFREVQGRNMKRNRARIANFLKKLADTCEGLLEKDSWFSIVMP